MKLSVSKVSKESGFDAIFHSCRDTKLLCIQRFVRLYAYGATFLILVQFLKTLDISESRVGLFMTLTLLGDVVISFVLTLITDQVGRRVILASGAAMMVISGGVFCVSSSYVFLLIASVFGVISPSGNEIGPFRAVEESILSQLTEKEKRSDIFAWYTMCGTAGAALGTFTSGWMVQVLQSSTSWTDASTYRAVFAIYTLVGVVKLALTLILSKKVELERPDAQFQTLDEESFELEDAGLLDEQQTSDTDDHVDDKAKKEPVNSASGYRSAPSYSAPASRPPPRNIVQKGLSLLPRISSASMHILPRLLLLFTLDSFASGLASPSWLTYFFTTYHALPPSSLGTLFLTTNILSTLSNLAALPLARRLGPLHTMVFTHLPSAIFLALVPLPSKGSVGTWLAVAFLALRACTQSMDQAPRQAFLAAAVLPAERTAVLGVVNIAKTLAQAGGLGVAGPLAGVGAWVAMFGGAGVLKGAYDLLMLWLFVRMKDADGDRM